MGQTKPFKVYQYALLRQGENIVYASSNSVSTVTIRVPYLDLAIVLSIPYYLNTL